MDGPYRRLYVDAVGRVAVPALVCNLPSQDMLFSRCRVDAHPRRVPRSHSWLRSRALPKRAMDGKAWFKRSVYVMCCAACVCKKPNWPHSYAFNMTRLESGQAAERPTSFRMLAIQVSRSDNRLIARIRQLPRLAHAGTPAHGTVDHLNRYLETVLGRRLKLRSCCMHRSRLRRPCGLTLLVPWLISPLSVSICHNQAFNRQKQLLSAQCGTHELSYALQ